MFSAQGDIALPDVLFRRNSTGKNTESFRKGISEWLSTLRLIHKINNNLPQQISKHELTNFSEQINKLKDLDMVDSRLPGSVLNFTGSIIQALAILCVPIM